jgi:proline iminopeptidase
MGWHARNRVCAEIPKSPQGPNHFEHESQHSSYVAYIGELRRQLPREPLRTLERYEASGEYTAPEYEKVMLGEVYIAHLRRLASWPAPLVCMFRHMNQKVYNTMQGPNEFVITGMFKDWDRWSDLKDVNVPALQSVRPLRYDERC